jgi:hypothetical protein
MTYGYIAEADIALGNYPEAETNAQWMMNMRPNNTPALLVGARLRMLYGDAHGAIDFSTGPLRRHRRLRWKNWPGLPTRSRRFRSNRARLMRQRRSLEGAEQTLPSVSLYHRESGARSHGPESSQRCGSTVDTGRSLDKDPHALYELARAQEAAGQAGDARATYAQFEKLASAPENGHR